MGEIKIGVAGWDYKDWNEIVYPPSVKKLQRLEFLSQFFDVIEINTSFYGHIRPANAQDWVGAVSGNPHFTFTAKLNRAFTHSPLAVTQPTSADTIRPGENDERDAKAGLDALMEREKLGAVLIQFPISFKNTDENREYLDDLVKRFKQYPLVLEVRHSSWNTEEQLRWLIENGIGMCNIDQPLLGRAIKPSGLATAPIGYVRLHGRNYEQWFTAEKPHDRYNYLYKEDELGRWKPRIESVAEKARITYAVANNHYQGKAAVNALQLKHLLTKKPVAAPESLVEHYPVLKQATRAA
ncbi:MAG: DUF72 domain-containing protein [Acidobacteriales bacterium]|nr:DUF72 domain-containing protein [Terriglobales bacterium]